MKSLKVKDINFRNNFHKRELINRAEKYIYIERLSLLRSLKKEKLFKKVCSKIIFNYLKFKAKKYSRTKLQRRCLITNRAKVSISELGISRMKLKEMFKYNIIPGYKKAVW